MLWIKLIPKYAPKINQNLEENLAIHRHQMIRMENIATENHDDDDRKADQKVDQKVHANGAVKVDRKAVQRADQKVHEGDAVKVDRRADRRADRKVHESDIAKADQRAAIEVIQKVVANMGNDRKNVMVIDTNEEMITTKSTFPLRLITKNWPPNDIEIY